ncbi:alpha/beta hydrolase [Aquirufa sp. 2-AUSEE-184A6]|uniref:Alpha/beta hydrolase n=1 Tax=Aquirufa novilacunae TaxID=3139305 RepID=A0ABW8SY80_9BACT
MKETIVFVHGMAHGAWCWEEHFIPYFEKLGYNCVAFDLPGHEVQGSTRRISYSLGDYVKALHRVVADLEAPPIIIGHSMGGMILQHFLKTGTCKKAVLLGSVPPEGVLAASFRVLLRYPGVIPYLISRDLVGAFTRFPKLILNDPALSERYAPLMCAESFVAYLGLMLPFHHRTSVPLLVVGGSADGLITIQEFANTAKLYKAKLEIIKGGSHDLMLDKDFEKTAEVIKSWLEEK